MAKLTEQKAYAEALRRIEKCRSLGLRGTNLNLNDLGLITLPPEIEQCTALTKLQLFNNQLTTLPPEIRQCTALTSLSLYSNQLTTLPPEIGQCTALTSLHLFNNQLTTLPPEIGQCKALKSLDLDNNQLTTLPPEIGQCKALTSLDLDNNQLTTLPPEIGKCTKLTELNLGGNQLATLPQEIEQCTALTSLALFHNQLTTLPPRIGQCKALTSLILDSNQLTTLPPEIGECTALTLLDLQGNQLTTLPPEIGQCTALETLDLQDNQLTTLPPEIGQCTALTKLFLHCNPTLDIPDSVLGPTLNDFHSRKENRQQPARPADILNFYFAQQRGAEAGTLRAVNEIKVMLVGRGEAGKTSLRRFFLGEDHNSKEKETQGIALDSFPLPCPQEETTVRLWDFAGQEITHALHHFFLTEGCVYILVLDPRSDTEMRDAEYWLGLLRRYAGNSPVVVAMNRQDARKGGYDIDRRVLKERFPNIHAFVKTNCELREGCDELLEKLCDAINCLKETEPPRLQVPNAWLKVMEQCFEEGNEPTDTQPNFTTSRQQLTLDEFREICAMHGENEPEKQESLARLLHSLGAVLHFVDDPRLRDTSVLNPHWVTDGAYRLLRYKKNPEDNPEDNPENNGILTLDEAMEALPKGETEESARFFLRLMERFEMCFPVEETNGTQLPPKWLIPGTLDKYQPDDVSMDWMKPGSVKMRYCYDPLPEGVLPRFIVLTHPLSEDQPRWRNGVILKNGEAKAMVRRAENPNNIEVIAFGSPHERLRLLEIAQGALERINTDIPAPKPYAELELEGLPGVYRPMTDIEAAERTGNDLAIKSEDGISDATVEPTPQLDRTSESESRHRKESPLRLFLSYSHKDKNSKNIFQMNLTVMEQKNLITHWHDGLIEPGMRWREEIEENLDKMDVFVGLLTTPFLCSNFIKNVELQAARKRLQEQDRDFVFVLILVDEISLEGLDLAEYQIMKPGGKAISRHKSRREGFNIAQKELEKLIKRLQKEKTQNREEPNSRHPTPQETTPYEGVKVIVKGDYFEGNKYMKDDHSINIGGDVINSQVGQTLENCTNTINNQPPGEKRDLLEELESQVKELIGKLPDDKQEEAAGNLELLVKGATASTPNRKWYSVSAEGLLEASEFVKDFSGNIAGTIGNLGKVIWPGFALK
jgi:internalin A